MRVAGHLARALSLLLVAAAPAQALPGTLPPVEQCSGDRSLDLFRHELGKAVARRDREALLAMFAPDVLVNFGGSAGRAELVKAWEFDAAEYPNIWDQLDTMLKLGCARSGEARVIPSLSAQLGPQDADDLIYNFLILPGAQLYKEAGDATGTAIEPWTVAKATFAGDAWSSFKLPDGRDGVILEKDLYDLLGYRLLIEKRDGKWMITALVAGD